MSPEQARREKLDARTDLFSFGAVLYEMATGRPAFDGTTSAMIFHQILGEAPESPIRLNPSLPSELDEIISKALEKDHELRYQHASEVRADLKRLKRDKGWGRPVVPGPSPAERVGNATRGAESVRPETPSDSSDRLTHGTAIGASQPRPRPKWARVGLEALLVIVVIAGFILQHKPEIRPPQLRAAILPPSGEGFWANLTQPAAISPDGRLLAIVSMTNGQRQLWLRRLDATEAQPIAGTEDATNPFWSPNGRYVGFFTLNELKKVDVAGGTVSEICPIGEYSMGGSWSSRGVIVFSSLVGTLRRVSENGGTPEPVPGIRRSPDALGQYWPVFLPDERHLIYLEWRYGDLVDNVNTVWVGSLDGGEKPRQLPLKATNVEYLSGFLLFSREGDLLAQSFDLKKLELVGSAVPVARHIQYDTFFDNAAFTASLNGILVYAPAGTGVNSQLTWVNRAGETLGVLGEPAEFESQRISPDGKRVAVGVKDPAQGERIWVYDVARGTRLPLTPTVLGTPYGGCWSPDGKQIAYRTVTGKTSAVCVRESDGSGQATQIGGDHQEVLIVNDWLLHSRYLLVSFWQLLGQQGSKKWLQTLPIAADAKPQFLATQAETGGIPLPGEATVSPDQCWVAYQAKDGQLYVTRFPGPGAQIAISVAGGSEPRWRGDGQELFYVTHDRNLIAVQVHESPRDFQVISSHTLFHLTLPAIAGFYDVTRDGQRFLVNRRTRLEEAAPLIVAIDWQRQLRF
jgi:hypothetical protein